MKRETGRKLKHVVDVEAVVNEVDQMTDEGARDLLNGTFSFGEVWRDENIDTVKLKVDQTYVEAYFIYLYVSVICQYGGLNRFRRRVERVGLEKIPPPPLFPVGALCPNCFTTLDISEDFGTHTLILAMRYCIDNDLEFSTINVEALDTDKILQAIRDGRIADSFKYNCSYCYFGMEYESLTQDMIENMSERPIGYLDTSIPVTEQNTSDSVGEWSWDKTVSFVLFNLHYIELCNSNPRRHLRIVDRS